MSVQQAGLLMALQKARALPDDEALIDRLRAQTNQTPESLASALSVPLMASDALASLQPALQQLTLTFCIERTLLLARDDDGWILCLDDPWQTALIAQVSQRIGVLPKVVWARKQDIRAALHRHGEQMRAVDDVLAQPGSLDADETSYEISIASIEAASNPVVRFIDAAILDGWRSGASDIHLETQRSGIALKYRLDGVLIEVSRFEDARRQEEVLNRIKVIAGLDISERRIPQDGRFRAQLSARQVDFRVSIMPSIHGEDAVIRILDKSHLGEGEQGISLAALGLPDEIQAEMLSLAREPHGMLLVTGPTGSGKTTTLYAVLSETRSSLEKIITIEDPVEYELPGVLQIPVNEKKGLSFSRGLRSILRHDPDRLLVGEIRDPETAEIAVQAALTGHGVLTTVHANNSFDAVNRFVHMGVDLYAFTAAINGIVAQRLMRRVCPVCAKATVITPAIQRWLESNGIDKEGARLRSGSGCEACRYTGYKGRFAVAEVLRIDDHFRQLIISRAPIAELKAVASSQRQISLRAHALNAVLNGQTTEEEFRRVVAAQ